MKLWWRMVLALLGMLSFTILLCFLGGIKTFGTILFFVDSVSLLLILFFTLIASLITYSFKEGWYYLSLTWKKEIDDKKILKKGVLFLKNLGGLVLLSGALGFLIGVILMMVNLENTSSVGPNMAVALISILYAFFIRLMMIQPLENSLAQRILE